MGLMVNNGLKDGNTISLVVNENFVKRQHYDAVLARSAK